MNCNYEVTSQWNVAGYSCEAEVLFLGDARNVTEVSNNHMEDRNNSDVLLLIISEQPQLTVVPRNIFEFFPNLAAMGFFNTSIEEITFQDLRGLRRLVQLELEDSGIAEIENDLFIDNLLMRSISFNSNRIQHIGHRTFNHLTGLTYLFLQDNMCIDMGVQLRANVLLFVPQLFRVCPPSFRMTEAEILDGTALIEVIDREIEPIENELEMLRKRIQFLES